MFYRFEVVNQRRGRGFTLIELLIVIAIILILIAIALPNFLEAQIRARVTKAKGEIRSISIAMESYYLDWKLYPAEHERDQNNRTQRGLSWLTSPIQYITALGEDPFSEFTQDSDDTTFITYETGGIENDGFPLGPDCGRICMVTYAIFSNGPDGLQSTDAEDVHNNLGNNMPVYAPTNGTKSYGEIIKYGGDPFWIGVNMTNGGGDVADIGLYRQNPSQYDGGLFVNGYPHLHQIPQTGF